MSSTPFLIMCALAAAGCTPAPPAGAQEGASGGAGTESAPADPAFEAAAAEARKTMAEALRAKPYAIVDERVLAAMASVPRHRFVPENMKRYAYADSPLPIGYDQTISQPYIVAFMTEQLKPRPEDVVLEVGTGSGYQAAVLAGLVKHVYTIEIVEPLAERSKKVLAELEYKNVSVRAGDGYRGWPEHAPFDAIIVTCAPERVPEPLVDQLKEGGRMIIPVGKTGGSQYLYVLRKEEGKVRKFAALPVRFVPMTGEVERGK